MNNLDSIDRFYSEQQAEGAFNYYTFRQVNGAADKIINRLRGVDNIDVFYNIKTSTLSLMQPKVRIYKVTHETFNYNADGTVDQGSVRPLPVPIYREFAFSDNFGIIGCIRSPCRYTDTTINIFFMLLNLCIFYILDH